MKPQESSDLSKLSMQELFSQEVETQTSAITEGLLALESGAAAAPQLETLMRAAHSLKGAARIVNRGAAVSVAHAMEDCFTAAQRGELALPQALVDWLLQGVDLLSRIGALEEDRIAAWEDEHRQEIESFVQTFHSWKDNSAGQQSPATTHPDQSGRARPSPNKAAPPNEKAGKADRAMRVNAQQLGRLVGLAGELLIAARRPKSLLTEVLQVRRHQNRLGKITGELREMLGNVPSESPCHRRADAMRRELSACQQSLARHLDGLDSFDSELTNLTHRLYREALQARMRPFQDAVGLFPRMVRDLARQLGKEVQLEISGEATLIDRDILDRLEAPLTQILRNCVDHGIETSAERRAAGKPPYGKLHLDARHHAGMLLITVSDDGRGLDPETIRRRITQRELATPEMAGLMAESELYEFLFLPGFTLKDSVTEISGRGVGLDVVQTMVSRVGGRVRVQSESGSGTRFTLELPITLSVLRALVVDIANEPYAIPLSRLFSVLQVPRSEIESVEGRHHFRLGAEQVGLIPADQALELETAPSSNEYLAVVVLGDKARRYGLVVDCFRTELELVVLPLDRALGKLKNISAGAILPDRRPVLILDVDDLLRSIESLVSGGRLDALGPVARAPETAKPKRVLVVDDSLTVRELQRKLLSSRGYHVDVAVDGMDGWNSVRSAAYDLVVTDVDMPRLDGIELVELIKKDSRLNSLPVVIVSYKDREEDRRRGLDAGADYYLTKASFHDESLLQAVADLIGGRR